MTRIEAAIAIVARDGKVLICQRRDDDDALPGYWEFPGGKCEDGETLEQCLRRELREEVNIDARPVAPLPPIEQTYPHGQIRLHPFLCEHRAGEPELLECQRAIWVEPHELRNYRFPPANEELIARMIEHFKRSQQKAQASTIRVCPMREFDLPQWHDNGARISWQAPATAPRA